MRSCATEQRLRISEILDLLHAAPYYADQIEATGIEPARDADFQPPERKLLPELAAKLNELGIQNLYSHQSAAFDLAESGKNVMVTTGTGSGKSLCYNLAVLNRLLSEPRGTALYLFPTKALAQDQLRHVRELSPDHMEADVYDGDTPKSKRSAIRKSARIVLTNPDMLHVGVLPYHQLWAKFFKSLRFVVVDELHAYSGVFGSHVALILRRLKRLCELHGSKPLFIATSATISNPEQHFASMFGERCELVSRDGGPQGERQLVFWNPPIIDGTDDRRSPYTETANIVSTFVQNDVRFLAFSGSRLGVELILNYSHRLLKDVSANLTKRVEAYRGGYTPKDRRAIEKRIFSGDILGLCTTNAMELGVDIGALDAVIMCGYPGTITALRQQSGRAGRGTKSGLGILVARNNPLDQFFVKNHSKLLMGKPEPAFLKLSNRFVLSDQLLCAAYEHPVAVTELADFPENSLETAELLENEGLLSRKAGRWFTEDQEGPAFDVNIRTAGSRFDIFDGETWIGGMEEWRAYEYAHPGAIYLHQGKQYLVTELDFEQSLIRVEPTQSETYTQAIVESSVWQGESVSAARVGKFEFCLAALTVTSSVHGYRVRSTLTDHVVLVHDLDLPDRVLETVGVCIDLPTATSDDENSWAEGVHALEHAAVVIAPIIAACDARDVQSVFYPLWPETMRPRIFVYDSAAGGSGVAESLFLQSELWLKQMRELLFACRCEDGCPSCVMTPFCSYGNANLSRKSAMRILE